MSTSVLILVLLSAYFGLNFLCALVLHLHAERQAHLPVRLMDVVVHFVLLTAFAMPVLLVISFEAMFGRKEQPRMVGGPDVPHVGARAA